MRYFIDTEYDWHPSVGVLFPLTIALVAEDGREFYAATDEVVRNAELSGFVAAHVIPVIGDVVVYDEPPLLARAICEFVGGDVPEFWGDYSAFDYVVLSMLMGEFDEWPMDWPMYVNDCQQDAVPSRASKIPHNALSDARAVRDGWDWAFFQKVAS